MILPVLLLMCFSSTRVLGITGGELAKDGEFPFMVSIRNSRNCHICGGTIIGDRWVLTGNPCYANSWFGSIRFGSNSLGEDCGEFDNSTQVKMDDALYNPWANDQAPYTHDSVLIHLSEPITFSDNVQPVKLPGIDEAWPANRTGTILGWGSSVWTMKGSELQKAEVPLYSDEYCHDARLWDGWSLVDSTVMKCGGELNKTYYCSMDYGGPLLLDGIQYGIMSYVYSPDRICGEYLGIFSPVAYFRKWIKDTTGI